MNAALGKGFAVVLIPLAIFIIPPPAGLTAAAWHLFAVYAAAILGIMLRPFPEPVVLLAVLSISALCLGNTGAILGGYASGTAWMVFAAFLLSRAFIDTGLGKRIAYHLIGRFGKTALGLGYVAAFTDLIVAPATPSNTARSGGITYPIFRNIAVTLGSEPGQTGRQIGSYLTLLIYQISLITGMIFLTAMAPNILIADFAKKILGVDITWGVWFSAACAPGLLVLLLAPYIVYKLYPPELKQIPNARALAAAGLREMGPMKAAEKRLALFFILAVAGWATSSLTGLNATAITLALVAACLVFQIMSWSSVLEERGAWNTLIWYGGIIGIAGALAKAGFFVWLAKAVGQSLDVAGMGDAAILAVLLFLSLIVRYLFASMAAYVTSFVPVLFTIGLAAQAPLPPLALLIGFSAGFGCMLTHYGGALGPVLFGTGYVGQKDWWYIGAVMALINFIAFIGLGLPLWKWLGLW